MPDAPDPSEQNDPNAKDCPAARCLRELAGAGDADRPRLLHEFQRITGHGAVSLGDALDWYLRHTLHIPNAMDLLADALARRLHDGASAPVFDRPEYNWCALEKVKNPDDMEKLRQLYLDLETPLQIDGNGALSFRRLSGASEEELAFFRGKSVSEALFSPDVLPEHLKILKEYGKMMMMPVFPAATQRAGAIIYAAAISQALVRFGRRITSLSGKDLTESLPGLISRSYMVERYVQLFQEALRRCE